MLNAGRAARRSDGHPRRPLHAARGEPRLRAREDTQARISGRSKDRRGEGVRTLIHQTHRMGSVLPATARHKILRVCARVRFQICFC